MIFRKLARGDRVIHHARGARFFKLFFRRAKSRGMIIIDDSMNAMTSDQALLGEAVRTYGSHHPATEYLRDEIETTEIDYMRKYRLIEEMKELGYGDDGPGEKTNGRGYK